MECTNKLPTFYNNQTYAGTVWPGDKERNGNVA